MSFIILTVSFPCSTLLPFTTTFAPSRPKRIAVARPIPDVAPDIMATLFFNLMIFILILWQFVHVISLKNYFMQRVVNLSVFRNGFPVFPRVLSRCAVPNTDLQAPRVRSRSCRPAPLQNGHDL